MTTPLTRRQAVTTIAAAAAFARVGFAAGRAAGEQPAAQPPAPTAPPSGPLALPPLPYDKAALEPHIDAETMEFHHDRHHKAYVDNANKALAGTKWADMTPEQIVAVLADMPDDKRTVIRNNVGGHLNHSWFWRWMAPPDKGGGGEPTGALADAIKNSFGSFADKDGFKDKFAAAATGRFGSGWAWLCVNRDKSLSICSTANQDNPLMGERVAGCAGAPILALDVWEHAYYLKYRNKRADYVAAWWSVVHWSRVAEMAAG